jgi:hypothetical protein
MCQLRAWRSWRSIWAHQQLGQVAQHGKAYVRVALHDPVEHRDVDGEQLRRPQRPRRDVRLHEGQQTTQAHDRAESGEGDSVFEAASSFSNTFTWQSGTNRSMSFRSSHWNRSWD